MVAVAPVSLLTLLPVSSVIPSFPSVQLVVPGCWISTSPPTIDKTVKGVKAATFVEQEDTPRIKDSKTGTNKITRNNRERVDGM
jgi:hypothetical protein